MKRSWSVLALLVACAPGRTVPPLHYEAIPPAPEEPFRQSAPSRPPVSDVVDPPPHTWALPNGLQVLLFERHGFPTVAARLVVTRGPVDIDDAGGTRVAHVMHLLGRGGSDRAYAQLRADFERTGITSYEGLTRSALQVAVHGGAGELDSALDFLARLTFRATLTPSELARREAEWVRYVKLGGVSLESAERLLLFGPAHAYGFARAGANAQDEISVEAANETWRSLFRPAQSCLVVVGDVTPEKLGDSATQAFDGWAPSGTLPVAVAAPPGLIVPRVAFVSRRGMTQMHAAVFARGPAPTSLDALAVDLATEVLGGGRSGGLWEELRSRQGAAYEVRASHPSERTASWVSIAAKYDVDKAVDGVAAVLASIRRLREGEMDDEVHAARERLVSSWREGMATVDGAAALYASAIAMGTDLDAVREYPARVERVGVGAVVQAAQRYLGDSVLHVVFMGEDRWLDVHKLGMGGAEPLDMSVRGY